MTICASIDIARATATRCLLAMPRSRSRASAIRPERVPNAEWLLADACELSSLEEAGLESCDVAIAATGDDKVNIVMVGRLAPNKAHPALIEAFASYHHDYNSESRLIIIGKEETRLRKYSPLLRELANRLKIKDAVVFAGEVSDEGLKAYYQIAHAFMLTSEHEGFCVPLVEAMAMGVPVVATSAALAAVPGMFNRIAVRLPP